MNENPANIAAKSEPTSASNAPASPPDNHYKGYGGWLMFFCMIRLCIAPLFILVSGSILMAMVANGWDRGDWNAGYLPFVVFIGNVCIFIFGFMAALDLRKLRPGAVRFVKRYLIVRLT